MFQKYKSWDVAEKSCNKSHAHLVKTESKEENEFLLNEYLQLEGDEWYREAWIGLTDKEKEGKFVWTDGTTLKQKGSFTNWADEQPNNEDGLKTALRLQMECSGLEDFRKLEYGVIFVASKKNGIFVRRAAKNRITRFNLERLFSFNSHV